MIVHVTLYLDEQVGRVEELPGPRFRITPAASSEWAGQWVEADELAVKLGEPIVYRGNVRNERGDVVDEARSLGIVTRILPAAASPSEPGGDRP